ncbi:Nitrilase 3 [Wickerhamomyces ciferrii]|uniref:Nitrilase 3 n=1 Tax=Wickerhamomyces ciferrii (strain ATCC 14091 / BCRC 22168 / CBS 111 / JCM 3599 / NBRC 0793 / NRRL Y-1031 F-60-10) TaxID=1206466 RepID=K0KHU9_WICCF|nr:Nitrilase 3 [Wickerhamomyces ciferrii]CCH40974.1 Nitrilase 3 [Wickerhamomyces ciferrii]
MSLPVTKVAACHLAPVLLNKEETIKKVISSIEKAAAEHANIIVFPETFVSAFPVWSTCKAPIDNHELFVKLVESSLYVDGPEIESIKELCKSLEVVVLLGFNERSRVSVGGLWNSYVLIDENGNIGAHHRKLVPTYFEKLSWANGDGSGLNVVDSKYGKIGALICGENTSSLARFTLLSQGEQIHLSIWPPAADYQRPGTAKSFDNITANKIRCGIQCLEGKCFGVICSSFLDEDTMEFLVKDDPSNEEFYRKQSQGATFFLDPAANEIGDFLQHEEGIAYATFDLNKTIVPKQFHDLVGGYNRFDVFKLRVNRSKNSPIEFEDEEE